MQAEREHEPNPRASSRLDGLMLLLPFVPAGVSVARILASACVPGMSSRDPALRWCRPRPSDCSQPPLRYPLLLAAAAGEESCCEEPSGAPR